MTTRVAQLTPSGRGAVATLALEGPQAIDAVATYFHPHAVVTWPQIQIGRILIGRWMASHDRAESPSEPIGEELVVCRTDTERIEIHCHGGQAAVTAIVQDLQRYGCTAVDWPALSANSIKSRTRAAAQRVLAAATTERTARIALDQYRGALDRALSRLARDLDEGRWTSARQRVAQLLRHADLGIHLAEPWRVVLTGPPNVGKSCLINALVGFQRAVVFDTPGTTRDVVTVNTAIDGWPVELSDTAGIRSTDDPLESIGIDRAIQQTQIADLVLLVSETTESGAEVPIELQSTRADLIPVLNKCDRRSPSDAPPAPGTLLTSAVTGQGIGELITTIGRQLVPHPPAPGTAVPLDRDQIDTLNHLLSALDRAAGDEAQSLLARWLSE